MSIFRYIAGPLIYLGINYLLTIKKANDQLSYDVVGVDFKGVSEGRMNLDLYLKFTNPQKIGLPINNILLDVFIGDTKLASIKQVSLDTNILIPSGESPVIPFHVQSEKIRDLLNGAGEVLQILIDTDKFPSEAHIKGTVKVAGIVMPYDSVVPFKNKA